MNNRKINSIISAYRILRKQNPDQWLIDCAESKTIKQAIELAATAKNFIDKKHGHQHRIPNAILDEFALAILEKVDDIEQTQSFDELISIIDSCKLKGVSDLTVYDTAQRLGCFLKLYPQRIYLHRGTRIGAEILLGKIKSGSILVNQLPEPFQTNNLTAAEIEDILCIYKERLKTCV